MKIINQSHIITFMPDPETLMKALAEAGWTCYQTEHKDDPEAIAKFIKGLIKKGHHSVIEHMGITVKFITDRGVSHELVRHRLASFSQESTRYCNYRNKGLSFIIPIDFDLPYGEYKRYPEYFGHQERTCFIVNGKTSVEIDCLPFATWLWIDHIERSEIIYQKLLDSGQRPEQARSVLPNSLKTEIVMTANIREWRHVFSLRCAKAAHPQIRALLLPLLEELAVKLPVLFGDVLERLK